MNKRVKQEGNLQVMQIAKEPGQGRILEKSFRKCGIRTKDSTTSTFLDLRCCLRWEQVFDIPLIFIMPPQDTLGLRFDMCR